MTFISEALYDSLKKEQSNLLSQINEVEEVVEKITARVKSEEAFLASYDETTAKLEASIKNLENLLPVLEDRLVALEESLAKNEKSKDEQIDLRNDLEEKRNEAIKEGRPQSEIDAINAQINAATSRIVSLEKLIDSQKIQITSIKNQIVDSKKIIKESNEALADNAARKEGLDSGELDELKNELQKSTDELAVLNAQYADFIAKNQATMNAFEAQDERRNRLIRVIPNRELYNRLLPEAENNFIANEDNVLKEVIENDLGIKDLSAEEAKLVSEAIEASSKDSFDPNFLTADQASNMSRAANFSLLPVSAEIKNAAMSGFYFIIAQNLSDSNIYALEQAGYTVILTDNDRPEFEVRWDEIANPAS